jgi:hypothetical protein
MRPIKTRHLGYVGPEEGDDYPDPLAVPGGSVEKKLNLGLPNLARRQESHKDPYVYIPVDETVASELEAAGIEAHGFEVMRGHQSEVPTKFVGIHCMWTFKRAWRYYVATGPGIPPRAAEEFYKTWGAEVRVDGHGCGPSPREYFKGFAVGMYHIDTLAGLIAFAKLLSSIYKAPVRVPPEEFGP